MLGSRSIGRLAAIFVTVLLIQITVVPHFRLNGYVIDLPLVVTLLICLYLSPANAAVMGFVKRRYNICISHGNGPQVGAELQRNELTQDVIPPLPLGVLVANTQGAIGYMIQQSLQNALYTEDANREVVSIISQVKVDKDDPALKEPRKYIGKSYNKETAQELATIDSATVEMVE